MLAACSLQRVALAGSHSRQCSSRSPRAVVPQRRRLAAAPAASLQQRERQTQQQQQPQEQQQPAPVSLASLAALWALAADLPAAAADIDLSGGPPASSYYVSLGLFLITVPGLWSLIKRSPKAKIKRKTFEVAGPAQAGAMPLDQRARQIFDYFQKYNYEVKERGEVITFEGNYRASPSQAFSLVLYTLIGLASTALVLSIAVPQVGNWWYAMCAVSPAAGAYYWQNAERTEVFKVKMVTSDDEQTTDITVEGDDEEIERFWKELGLMEKGKVLVKGILG
ncbi:hypothetical protein COHA_007579 [Chlorella ohadii]|uniref:Uncharacterized protein n=1 Tax=Chlorella ohadii TaxID=2649997 RepID=A0AAD5H2G7_9CHLO|nr:hypothetical protein COHA_007579 [Chlorella ohadii]